MFDVYRLKTNLFKLILSLKFFFWNKLTVVKLTNYHLLPSKIGPLLKAQSTLSGFSLIDSPFIFLIAS